MNTVVETGIIIAVTALAAAFVVLRIVRTLRSKRPSCCGGDGRRQGDRCPHCGKT
jgi:transposase